MERTDAAQQQSVTSQINEDREGICPTHPRQDRSVEALEKENAALRRQIEEAKACAPARQTVEFEADPLSIATRQFEAMTAALQACAQSAQPHNAKKVAFEEDEYECENDVQNDIDLVRGLK